MPLSFYRIVCGTCERVISDGWPVDETIEPETLRVITKHTCRGCEEEAQLQANEDRRHEQRRRGAIA